MRLTYKVMSGKTIRKQDIVHLVHMIIVNRVPSDRDRTVQEEAAQTARISRLDHYLRLNPQFVNALISHSSSSIQEPLIHLALRFSAETPLLKTLLQHGADLRLLNNLGESAYHVALRFNPADQIDKAIQAEHAKVDQFDASNRKNASSYQVLTASPTITASLKTLRNLARSAALPFINLRQAAKESGISLDLDVCNRDGLSPLQALLMSMNCPEVAAALPDESCIKEAGKKSKVLKQLRKENYAQYIKHLHFQLDQQYYLTYLREILSLPGVGLNPLSSEKSDKNPYRFPLHAAIDPETPIPDSVCDLLYELGADFCRENFDGRTAYEVLAQTGRFDLIAKYTSPPFSETRLRSVLPKQNINVPVIGQKTMEHCFNLTVGSKTFFQVLSEHLPQLSHLYYGGTGNSERNMADAIIALFAKHLSNHNPDISLNRGQKQMLLIPFRRLAFSIRKGIPQLSSKRNPLSLLIEAVEQRNPQAVRSMLSLGQDIKATTSDARPHQLNALECAVNQYNPNSSTEDLAIIHCLLDHGATGGSGQHVLAIAFANHALPVLDHFLRSDAVSSLPSEALADHLQKNSKKLHHLSDLVRFTETFLKEQNATRKQKIAAYRLALLLGNADLCDVLADSSSLNLSIDDRMYAMKRLKQDFPQLSLGPSIQATCDVLFFDNARESSPPSRLSLSSVDHVCREIQADLLNDLMLGNSLLDRRTPPCAFYESLLKQIHTEWMDATNTRKLLLNRLFIKIVESDISVNDTINGATLFEYADYFGSLEALEILSRRDLSGSPLPLKNRLKSCSDSILWQRTHNRSKRDSNALISATLACYKAAGNLNAALENLGDHHGPIYMDFIDDDTLNSSLFCQLLPQSYIETNRLQVLQRVARANSTGRVEGLILRGCNPYSLEEPLTLSDIRRASTFTEVTQYSFAKSQEMFDKASQKVGYYGIASDRAIADFVAESMVDIPDDLSLESMTSDQKEAAQVLAHILILWSGNAVHNCLKDGQSGFLSGLPNQKQAISIILKGLSLLYRSTSSDDLKDRIIYEMRGYFNANILPNPHSDLDSDKNKKCLSKLNDVKAVFGSEFLSRLFKSTYPENKTTIFMEFCSLSPLTTHVDSYIDLFDFFIENGSDVNQVDANGFTPLCHLMTLKRPRVDLAAYTNAGFSKDIYFSVPLVRELIRRGANVNHRYSPANGLTTTPFLTFCTLRSWDLIVPALQKGACLSDVLRFKFVKTEEDNPDQYYPAIHDGFSAFFILLLRDPHMALAIFKLQGQLSKEIQRKILADIAQACTMRHIDYIEDATQRMPGDHAPTTCRIWTVFHLLAIRSQEESPNRCSVYNDLKKTYQALFQLMAKQFPLDTGAGNGSTVLMFALETDYLSPGPNISALLTSVLSEFPQLCEKLQAKPHPIRERLVDIFKDWIATEEGQSVSRDDLLYIAKVFGRTVQIKYGPESIGLQDLLFRLKPARDAHGTAAGLEDEYLALGRFDERHLFETSNLKLPDIDKAACDVASRHGTMPLPLLRNGNIDFPRAFRSLGRLAGLKEWETISVNAINAIDKIAGGSSSQEIMGLGSRDQMDDTAKEKFKQFVLSHCTAIFLQFYRDIHALDPNDADYAAKKDSIVSQIKLFYKDHVNNWMKDCYQSWQSNLPYTYRIFARPTEETLTAPEQLLRYFSEYRARLVSRLSVNYTEPDEAGYTRREMGAELGLDPGGVSDLFMISRGVHNSQFYLHDADTGNAGENVKGSLRKYGLDSERIDDSSVHQSGVRPYFDTFYTPQTVLGDMQLDILRDPEGQLAQVIENSILDSTPADFLPSTWVESGAQKNWREMLLETIKTAYIAATSQDKSALNAALADISHRYFVQLPRPERLGPKYMMQFINRCLDAIEKERRQLYLNAFKVSVNEDSGRVPIDYMPYVEFWKQKLEKNGKRCTAATPEGLFKPGALMMLLETIDCSSSFMKGQSQTLETVKQEVELASTPSRLSEEYDLNHTLATDATNCYDYLLTLKKKLIEHLNGRDHYTHVIEYFFTRRDIWYTSNRVLSYDQQFQGLFPNAFAAYYHEIRDYTKVASNLLKDLQNKGDDGLDILERRLLEAKNLVARNEEIAKYLEKLHRGAFKYNLLSRLEALPSGVYKATARAYYDQLARFSKAKSAADALPHKPAGIIEHGSFKRAYESGLLPGRDTLPITSLMKQRLGIREIDESAA